MPTLKDCLMSYFHFMFLDDEPWSQKKGEFHFHDLSFLSVVVQFSSFFLKSSVEQNKFRLNKKNFNQTSIYIPYKLTTAEVIELLTFLLRVSYPFCCPTEVKRIAV